MSDSVASVEYVLSCLNQWTTLLILLFDCVLTTSAKGEG